MVVKMLKIAIPNTMSLICQAEVRVVNKDALLITRLVKQRIRLYQVACSQ